MRRWCDCARRKGGSRLDVSKRQGSETLNLNALVMPVHHASAAGFRRRRRYGPPVYTAEHIIAIEDARKNERKWNAAGQVYQGYLWGNYATALAHSIRGAPGTVGRWVRKPSFPYNAARPVPDIILQSKAQRRAQRKAAQRRARG